MLLKDKTLDISKTPALDDEEKVIITTDDNIPVTSIGIFTTNKDESDGIVLTTDDNIPVTTIETSITNIDESNILEFISNDESETYAKIGTVDGSSGLFVDNIYDLNGNILLKLDPINDVMILFCKKYKLISYVEN